MVAINRPEKIKVGRESLFRLDANDVRRILTNLVDTHDVFSCSDQISNRGSNRECVAAVPKGIHRRGQYCWVGFTLDGRNWYGRRVRSGERSARLWRYVMYEVVQEASCNSTDPVNVVRSGS